VDPPAAQFGIIPPASSGGNNSLPGGCDEQLSLPHAHLGVAGRGVARFAGRL